MATKYWISTSSTSFSTAGNWSDGVAPANSDTLVFNGVGTANCSSDLSTVLTGVTIIVEKSYTGQIGTVSGATVTYLVLDGGTLKMPRTTGAGSASGSQRVMVNFGATAATVIIEDSNTTGAESYYPPVQILGTSLTAKITGGVVGFAIRPGDVSTLTSLITGKGGGTSAQVYLGEGVTLTSGVGDSGTIYDRANNTRTALRVGGATWEIAPTSTGATTTANVDDGKLIFNGSGTIGQLNCRKDFDSSANPNAYTVTNSTFYRGFNVNIDNGDPTSVTWTNATQFPDGMNAGTLRTPQGMKALIDNI